MSVPVIIRPAGSRLTFMPRALLSFWLLTICATANAADVWVLGGTVSKPLAAFCTSLTLGSSTTVHNPTDTPLLIKLLDTTDPRELNGHEMTVPAHRTATVFFPMKNPPGPPSSEPPVTVIHLDVPDALLLDSHLEIGTFYGCTGIYPGIGGPIGGMIRLPVFRRLIPAGETTTHMGTELPGISEARLNVAIYNAGDLNAQAHVEVFRAWEDARLAERIVSVPARSIIQTAVVANFADLPPAPVGRIQPLAPWWMFYTRVTVDQPSLSVVSVLSNAEMPKALVTISN